MNFAGVAILGALLTLLRMLTGFAVTKFVAIYIGPTGVALLGQLQSFVAGLNGLIANQVGQGIVRFSAENKDSGFEFCQPWWSAATSLLLPMMTIAVAVTCIFSGRLSLWLFHNEALYWVVIVAGLSLPLNALNSVLSSVLNGLGQNRRNIFSSMLSVLITTSVSVVLLRIYGLSGGLTAVAINNAIAALVVVLGVYKQSWFRIKYWIGKTDNKKRKAILGYVLMGIVGALTGPTALISIRNIISAQVSIDAAGLWQAVSRVSEAYLSMFTIGVGMYFFPKAASIVNEKLLKNETKRVLLLIIPFVFIAIVCIYSLRDFIVATLYSKDFYSARDLFAPQLCGDLFRMLSFVPATLLMAKGYFKLNAAAEAIINGVYVLLVHLLVGRFGLIGANYSYMLVYGMYCIFAYIFFCYHCRRLGCIPLD